MEAVNIGRTLESQLKTGHIALTFEVFPGGFSDLIVNVSDHLSPYFFERLPEI